jgi:predicted amino acid-binding ACT domain protein
MKRAVTKVYKELKERAKKIGLNIRVKKKSNGSK